MSWIEWNGYCDILFLTPCDPCFAWFCSCELVSSVDIIVTMDLDSL